MNFISTIYRHSLALLTDLYQLTMAQGYYKSGRAEREAVFNLCFRRSPFGGSYAVACGLAFAVDFLRAFRFADEDLAYLAGLPGADGRPLFEAEFLEYLRRLEWTCDVDAMPEGTIAFAHEPLVRVKGPILQCQLLETPLLTMINFQTLLATKASRICRSAKGEEVVEFGLRRAQGIDGGLSASRAACVGGCASTSNVLAGKLFDLPVRGTHAHSWVMSFDSEKESFETYARAMPNNCVFLVDTYDTLDGVRNAVEVGQTLRGAGHEMVGIRLDSGDLGELSIQARRILDEGGFPDARIVASSDLDEYEIEKLKARGAKINVWGVGTRLATAYEQPALGGVYKLAAMRGEAGGWDYKIKLSEDAIKIPNPGLLQVRRFFDGPRAVADVMYDEPMGIDAAARSIDLFGGDAWQASAGLTYQDLLTPVFRRGQPVYTPPSVAEARQNCETGLASFGEEIIRLHSPASFPVGLEHRLHELKQSLIEAARTGQP